MRVRGDAGGRGGDGGGGVGGFRGPGGLFWAEGGPPLGEKGFWASAGGVSHLPGKFFDGEHDRAPGCSATAVPCSVWGGEGDRVFWRLAFDFFGVRVGVFLGGGDRKTPFPRERGAMG